MKRYYKTVELVNSITPCPDKGKKAKIGSMWYNCGLQI